MSASGNVMEAVGHWPGLHNHLHYRCIRQIAFVRNTLATLCSRYLNFRL